MLLSVGMALVLVTAAVALGALLRGSSRSRASAQNADVAKADTTESTASITTTTTEPTTTTIAPTTTTAPPEQPVPALPPSGLPDVSPAGLRIGASGPVVQAYEQRLADLHFDPGAVDGKFDGSTQSAVQGLQKLLGGARTGHIEAGERMALAFFTWPKAMVTDNPEPDRVEVDVARQVLVLYQGHQIRLITPVSTGTGEHYCYTPKGRPDVRACEYATTPSGKYAFTFFKKGWDKSPLGQLYNPYYFNGGIAVHGYQSVPVKPASHGCVRVPMYVADYFHTLVSKGESVYVFNGADQKSPVTTSRVAPPPLPPLPTDTAPVATAPPAVTAPTPETPTPTTAAPVTATEPPTTAAPAP